MHSIVQAYFRDNPVIESFCSSFNCGRSGSDCGILLSCKFSMSIHDVVFAALPCSAKSFRRDVRTGADMCRNTWV